MLPIEEILRSHADSADFVDTQQRYFHFYQNEFRQQRNMDGIQPGYQFLNQDDTFLCNLSVV